MRTKRRKRPILGRAITLRALLEQAARQVVAACELPKATPAPTGNRAMTCTAGDTTSTDPTDDTTGGCDDFSDAPSIPHSSLRALYSPSPDMSLAAGTSADDLEWVSLGTLTLRRSLRFA